MSSLLAAWILIGIVALVSLVVFVMLVTMMVQLCFFVPYVPTKKSVTKGMLDLAAIKPGETVYELGAGDGRIMIAAKKREPKATIKGYEIARVVWLLGKLRIWLSRKDVSYHKKNFLHEDLRDADVILAYLSPRYMDLIDRHCCPQFKSGTRIISHGFPFHERTTEQVVDMGRTKIYRYII